jgi:metal-sulfur cluster biosynthetic enzyme
MNGSDPSLDVKEDIISKLQKVIDPETNVDVIRMHLVEELSVDQHGVVSYTFRPSSPLCPIAVYLVTEIKKVVSEVPGVKAQKIKVEGYLAAEELTRLINQEV